MSRLMSLIALIAVIVVIGLLFYKVMVGFFVPVFLAAVLVVVFRPLHLYVLRKTGNRPKLAAVTTTLLIMLCVLIPFGLVTSAAALQGVGLVQDFNAGTVKVALGKLRNQFGLTLEYETELRRIQDEMENLRARAARADNSPPTLLTGSIDSETGVIRNEELRMFGVKLADALEDLRMRIQADEVSTVQPDLDQRLSDLAAQARNFGSLREGEFSFEDDAMVLSSQFRPIRTEILGGPYMAALKDLANPTDKQIISTTQQIIEFLQPRLLSLTSATVGFMLRVIIGCAILIVCVFFFLYDGPGMISTMMALIPLDDRYEAELLMEFDRVSRAVVLATVFSALTQGAAEGMSRNQSPIQAKRGGSEFAERFTFVIYRYDDRKHSPPIGASYAPVRFLQAFPTLYLYSTSPASTAEPRGVTR